ncbi:MAG: ATP synthase F1 subunit delta [Dehalococcoidia bacterium]|nr:ATP synthase F1 subunit delta [Dehalococcoidia bacterium]
MVSGTEATGWAQELFGAALAAKAPVQCLAELRRVSDLLKDGTLSAALTDAQLPAADKLKLLSGRAGELEPEVAKLVATLFDKGRLAEIDNIALEYQRLLDAHHGVEGAEVAEVTTAMALDEEAKLSLGKRLTEIMERPVVIKTSVDPAVIGGIIVRIGDKLIDGSIRSRLQTLSKELAI